jgi:hypothetical protein
MPSDHAAERGFPSDPAEPELLAVAQRRGLHIFFSLRERYRRDGCPVEISCKRTRTQLATFRDCREALAWVTTGEATR